MLTNIKLSNFRIHKSTNINISNRFVALVGKNDVGKSSVLEALDILCNSEINIAPDDQTKGSAAPANIEGTFDGITLDYSSPTINGNRAAAKTFFQKFGVDDNNHFIDLNQDLNSLIQSCDTECRLFIETTYTYHYERKKVEDIVNIFSILHQLYIDSQSSQPLKDVIDNFVVHNKDLQIIISNKEILFASNSNKDLLNSLFAILAPFETDFENAYLKGEDRINNIHFFEQRENRDLESLIIDKPLAEISTKCNEILARFDQYSNLEKSKDIAYLWEQYLNSFGSIDINLAKRGSGFKRLCEIYYFIMRSLAEYSNGSIILAVEEPEISLHPSQQRDIVNRLRDILRLPNTQVIISTHSPYIVNELDEESVCILKRESQTDANGNPIETVTTSAMNQRIIKYPSMAEVNYLAFDEPSITYHQELYGQVELEHTGKSDGNSCDLLIKRLWEHSGYNKMKKLIDEYNNNNNSPIVCNSGSFKNRIITPSSSTDRSLPTCIRNSVDHPCDDNRKWKQNMNTIGLSIKILYEINKDCKIAQSEFKKRRTTITDFDVFENKCKCSINGVNYSDPHSIAYWVNYCLDNPGQIVCNQDSGKPNMANSLYVIMALNEIDPDWLTPYL